MLLSACGALAPNSADRSADPIRVEPATSERLTGWNRDLDQARDAFLAADRSYPPERRAQAQQRIEALRTQLPTLGDTAVVAELARIAALSGNAHTRAYLLRNRGVWQRYPLRVWKFDDGWRVLAAQGGAEALVGGRLLRIGGRPVDQVAAALRPLFAGNDSWADYMATYMLTSPEALASAGLPVVDGRATFEVETAAGTTVARRLEPLPQRRRDAPEESWWYLSPRHPASSGWTHALAAAPPLPEMLRGGARWYRSLRCGDGVLYAQFTRAEDQPGEPTVAEWGAALLDQLKSDPPRILLLDLRFNTGGNLGKAHPLVQALAASEVGRAAGRIAVLSGVSTFSAGITPLAYLRGRSGAIVVGRPPGDEADFWAEGGNVVLAYSGTILHFADGLHAYSDRPLPPGDREFLQLGIDVPDLQPDRRVRWTWDDYRSGRDPDAEAAIGAPLRCPG